MTPPKSTSGQLASVIVFCPQSKAPQEAYLTQVQRFFASRSLFEQFRKEIVNLRNVWDIFAAQREDIAALEQGPRYMQSLADWITTGASGPISNSMSGIITLPLLVIMQIGQYFQYLEIHGIKHSEFIAQLRKGGGVQGYCGGLPPAIALACSKDEKEVLENAATAIRIALGIGAYGELGDDAAVPGATTIVVRIRKVGQGEELVSKFPGSYISGITDPKTISIVGPVPILAKLQTYAREQGCVVQEMHIRGKVHNPENSDLAKELCELADRTPCLQLPDSRSLQVSVRSNKTGQQLVQGSLTYEVIDTILASRCEWFILLTELAKDLDLSGRRQHLIATFGIGDCIPLSPFHKLQLQITKLDILSFVAENARTVQEAYAFPPDAVAIVGASCRLPGANDLEELWDLISKGSSQHKELPASRVNIHSSFRAMQDWKFAGKRKFYGNFIDDVDSFDNTFFRMNAKEALNMDPQQRILLELAYQAMESSGYLRNHRREAGDQIGCFIGASFTEYLDNTGTHPATAYTATGTIRAFLSGKLSYYFGWSGPSEVIDTACSASLVAVNRAFKAIQAGECNMALAGGINTISGVNNYLDLGKAGFLSSTGQCKPFDQSADGYCRADGAGLVVLKSLSQAIKDNDQILGVIPAVATNQGGLSSSITIPHSPAQIQLYKTILRQANMQSDQVSYIEAHGTGTQAGDPLEIASIREVFGGPGRPSPLSIGSLKGNVGHSETGAGVASLLKVLAMISHRRIPPLASHKSLNPKIPDLMADKMYFASKVERWDAPLLASCVNSYGAAGSNCALLCCEYSGPHSLPTDYGLKFPIIISAASMGSLFVTAERIGHYLAQAVPKPSIGDLAYTLSERRKHLGFCFTTTASEITGLEETLKTIGHNADASFEVPAPKPVILAFGGQSKQNIGFHPRLYQSCSPLRKYIDTCSKIIVDLGFSPILPAIFQPDPISDIVTLQSGTFTTQYACAMCWMDAGLEVAAVIGHSFGELTAMVVSGALSLLDGLKLITARASLMTSAWGDEKGTMLLIWSSPEFVENLVAETNSHSAEPVIEVACYNSPSSQVIVGNSSDITSMEKLLDLSKVRCQRLDVTHGFHSKFTHPILDGLNTVSSSLDFQKPEIPLETCTRKPLNEIMPDRPSRHAREPVYFQEAVQRVEERLGPAVWLEAGMNSPITSMAKSAVSKPTNHTFLSLKTPDCLSNATISLWRQGIAVSHWDFMPSKDFYYKPIWLPPYQFRPTRHWLDNVDRVMEAQSSHSEGHKSSHAEGYKVEPLRLITAKNPSAGEFYIHANTKRFTQIVSGHAVRQRPLCPASMYMEAATMAVQSLHKDFSADSLFFADISFQAALGLDPDREVIMTLESFDDSCSWNFTVRSTSKNKSTTHAKGRVGLTAQPKFQTYERLLQDKVTEIRQRPHTENLMSKRAYGLFSRVVSYAEFLQGISHISLNGKQAVGEVEVHPMSSDESTAIRSCDTVSIDAFIQVLGLSMNSSDMVSNEEVMIATGLESTSMSHAMDFNKCKSWTVYTEYKILGGGIAEGDVFVLTREGSLVMTITGVQFTKLLISKLEKSLDSTNAGASRVEAAKEKTVVMPTEPKPSQLLPDLSRSSSSSGSIPSDTLSTPTTTLPSPNSLKSLITEYTGLSAQEINENASIADLGVDSLAAVELAEELATKFGKDLSSEDLLNYNYEKLATICQVSVSVKDVPTAVSIPPIDKDEHKPVTATDSSRLSDLLRILSEMCGAPEASIKGEASLQELGMDSLSAVELKDELEDTFSTTIEDDKLSLDSTVKEIADILQVGFSHPAGITPHDPTADVARSKSSQKVEDVTTPKDQAPINIALTQMNGHTVETLVYKEVDGVRISADVYLPKKPCHKAMPIALMIHGGGHMTLSRKAVRPSQTAFLLAHDILPISLDYRLCPEINIIDGPMTDIRDAYAWARSGTGLQAALIDKSLPIRLDTAKIVVIGWSTGGHLAMTSAWTSKEVNLPPPNAILGFYSPTDFESGDLDGRRAEEYPERKIPMEKIIASLPTRPLTSYDSAPGVVDRSGLGWVRPGDPRSELVLSLFKENTGLPLLLNGLPTPTSNAFVRPSAARIAAICPMAHLRRGDYTVPTYLVHGEDDEIVPYHTARNFVQKLRSNGIATDLLTVPNAKHIHDMKLMPGTTGWDKGVGPGYDFLFKKIGWPSR